MDIGSDRVGGGNPVVSLVPSSTAGYRLSSLRDEVGDEAGGWGDYSRVRASSRLRRARQTAVMAACSVAGREVSRGAAPILRRDSAAAGFWL